MKAILIILILTISAQGYTKEQKRNLKYLKIEGIAAKKAAVLYKGKLDIVEKEYIRAEKKVESLESEHKELRKKYKCRYLKCQHGKDKSCYKFRTILKKSQKEIREAEELLERIGKKVELNKKFYSSKISKYDECLEQYKNIVKEAKKMEIKFNRLWGLVHE